MRPGHALGVGRFRGTCKPASTPHPLPRYDVSGVGLNLGTAEEFATKTVRSCCKIDHPMPPSVAALNLKLGERMPILC